MDIMIFRNPSKRTHHTMTIIKPDQDKDYRKYNHIHGGDAYIEVITFVD